MKRFIDFDLNFQSCLLLIIGSGLLSYFFAERGYGILVPYSIFLLIIWQIISWFFLIFHKNGERRFLLLLGVFAYFGLIVYVKIPIEGIFGFSILYYWITWQEE